ncbi:hypothetical protein, partial [Escherichia coli]|uniref:hypothetical protein n=1 Tax=Escherichia coli TaxID=562 RepID=UPI001A8CAC37
ADRNRSHWSTSKTPSYTKSVSWQHHQNWDFAETVRYFSQSRNAETILEQKLLTDVEGTIQSDDTHWAQDLREMLGK